MSWRVTKGFILLFFCEINVSLNVHVKCVCCFYSADNVGKEKKKTCFPETSVLNCFSHPVHGWESNREYSDCESGKGRSYFELFFKCLFAKWHRCALGDSIKSQRVSVKEQDHGICTQKCILYPNFCCSFRVFCRDQRWTLSHFIFKHP